VWALAVLALLTTYGFSGVTAAPPAKKNPPRPLPKKIVAAWKKAGAQVGWMRVGKFNGIEFLPEKEGVAGDLPALKFSRWKAGVLARLPGPAAPFGLDLSRTQLTDAGLKQLARFKYLQALDLVFTQVTDAGLKHLAGLKKLQYLYLDRTKVTDAGVKELRKTLPGCRITC
jgi:hypothetical protein